MPDTLGYDYDLILSHLGDFGGFQKRILLLLSLVSAVGGLAVVVFPFTAFVPRYRCRVPSFEKEESSLFFTQDPTLSPWIGNLSVDVNTRCRNLVVTVSGAVHWATEADQVSELCDAEDLVYDVSIMTRSLVQDFSLVCDRQGLRTLVNISYMMGLLVAAPLFGWISDTWGRLRALTLSLLLVSLAGSAGALTGSAWGLVTETQGLVLYTLTRFLTGLGAMACFMTSFVLMVEHVSIRLSVLVGIGINIPFALGELLLGLEAFIVRDWVQLQLVAHAPVLGLTCLAWLCPESVRWLLAKGRVNEAKQIVRKIAKRNGKEFPAFLFENQKEGSPADERDSLKDPIKVTLVRMLWSSARLRTRMVNMGIQWFAVTLCYYGLSFASTKLSQNVFTDFMLSISVEVPGYVFSMLTINTWGRRPVLSLCMIVSGLACITGALLPLDLAITRLCLSLLGKAGASAAFAIVYLFTAEMFPTCTRNQSVGVCALAAKLGGVSTMGLELLSSVWAPAPTLIMGITALVAGGLALALPETLSTRLPDTLEEAEAIGRKREAGS